MQHRLKWLTLTGAVLALGVASDRTLAQSPPAPQARPAQAHAKPAKPPAGPEVTAASPLPVQQVKQIGVNQCVGMVDSMAKATLTGRYEVQSGWNRTAPGKHVFQSVAVLNKPQTSPPDSMTALVAAPTPGGSCDGVTMQVFPLASTCDAAQKLMLAGGSVSTPMLNARIMFDHNNKRIFLLPGFANTCIAVAVDSTFGGGEK
jgi:hypothetical protein